MGSAYTGSGPGFAGIGTPENIKRNEFKVNGGTNAGTHTAPNGQVGRKWTGGNMHPSIKHVVFTTASVPATGGRNGSAVHVWVYLYPPGHANELIMGPSGTTQSYTSVWVDIVRECSGHPNWLNWGGCG